VSPGQLAGVVPVGAIRGMRQTGCCPDLAYTITKSLPIASWHRERTSQLQGFLEKQLTPTSPQFCLPDPSYSAIKALVGTQTPGLDRSAGLFRIKGALCIQLIPRGATSRPGFPCSVLSNVGALPTSLSDRARRIDLEQTRTAEVL
jgi:hypothetical protein